MAFWTTETLKKRVEAEALISPFESNSIKHCAYELALGAEATVTMSQEEKGKDRKIILGSREPLVIPPGQFAMLLTHEKITVPADAIAFISIRASKKFDGLVNVSGFHVDPGFSGRLKFSVYNAGSRDIIMLERDRIFMIWYAGLDSPTKDLYETRPEQNEISTADLMRMQGEVLSPAQLRKDIVDLQHSITNVKVGLAVLTTLAIAIFGKSIFDSALASPPHDTTKPSMQAPCPSTPCR